MASRENSSDSLSFTGKSYPAGTAAATPATVRNISISKDDDATRTSRSLGKAGAFNGHAVEIHADGAVWDTVSSAYLFPGRDYNPGDVQRK
jgi:hypothetical protein